MNSADDPFFDLENAGPVSGNAAGVSPVLQAQSQTETVAAPEAASDAAGRVSDRHSIFMQGFLQLAHMNAPQKVRIRNLSEGGMLAETPLPATVDECLTVHLPNIGPVTGRVAWTALNKFGVAFDNLVDPHQVRRKVPVVKEDESELFQLPSTRRGRPGFSR